MSVSLMKNNLLEEVCKLIKTRVALWIIATSSEFQYSVHDVVANLEQVRYALH